MVGSAVVAALTLAPAAASQAATLTDGESSAGWSVVFAGYGTVTATSRAVNLRPAVAEDAATTHAALVVRDAPGTADRIRSRVTLNEQLRVGSSANPWETGWLLLRYTDPEHFYYLACKTNGWELGKRDPAYPGGQRFLATGEEPCAAVGDAANLLLAAKGNRLTVKVDGERVAQFTDTQRPYRSGQGGLYSEDADVTFDRLIVA